MSRLGHSHRALEVVDRLGGLEPVLTLLGVRDLDARFCTECGEARVERRGDSTRPSRLRCRVCGHEPAVENPLPRIEVRTDPRKIVRLFRELEDGNGVVTASRNAGLPYTTAYGILRKLRRVARRL